MKLLSLAALLIFTISTSNAQGRFEEILGVKVTPDGIEYQVFSGGCTKKKDFKIIQLHTFPVKLRLLRMREDLCEAFLPYGTTVTFSWSELGFRNSTEFVISNPLSSMRVYLF